MFALLAISTLAYNEEDFNATILVGETELKVTKYTSKYLVNSGLFVVFMPHPTDKLTGYDCNQKYNVTLFNNTYAVLFNEDGYFTIESETDVTIKILAYQQFGYPSCDKNVILIGNQDQTFGCQSSSKINLKEDSTVCVYVAFQLNTGSAKITNSGNFKYTVYDTSAFKIKTNLVTQPFMIKISNENKASTTDFLNLSVSVSGENQINALTLENNANTTYAIVGGAKEDEPIKPVIIVVIVIAVLAFVVIVAVVVALVIKCKKGPDASTTSKSPEQLEVGMVDNRKEDEGYNPMKATSPLADAHNHVPAKI
ncbi:hypothetical protein TVAG_366070 [Trichomonas vaginalis G3]|uniref:Uncharacterized protein n=1 Tax=Trichomonas vaginalis (strain ATCC PRA-98 / G3) TaxID=412133 RepID=A2DHQ1_TRIV3|nr:hypothetical protein TVAGG3_0303120 [Trichomonas vaginalis G3]EAY20099.1 hypothetical protein TVAG_366070 [Trichomonas vaginalis G3]KAI5528052.1 hypothetical protein TVAGG3_0303120 [Trichomonas vaginalis G3]|eukprot:XP_001581085.1 hypothetical protein [Trichomonas vaginalis G3]